MTDSRFSVSVVVAVWPDDTGIAACLDALAKQRDEHVQIIAVGMSPPSPEIVRQFVTMQWLTAASGALIPHLWSCGMAIATGEAIAITTAHFLPAPDWIAQIRAAFGRLDADGIGGPIDPPRGKGAAAWATYFLRYSVQFKHQREEYVDDVAGDNAAYRRAALARHANSMRDGFWEPEFHRRVIAGGGRLAFVPAMRLTLHSSFGVRRFCAQRFHHGQQFARDRVAGKSAVMRGARIVTAPLIPFVLLAKIVGRLRHRPAYVPAFLGALPVLALFACAWALGETFGYMSTAAKASVPDKTVRRASA